MNFHTYNKEGRTIAVYSKGEGKAVVGLSGFACFHLIYADIVEELSKYFKIILIENRGVGKSSPTTADYEISDLALDAKFVLDQMNIDEYAVMGISMGGFIAQELVHLAPKSVKALALMCTTGGHKDFVHPTALTEAGLRQFASLDPQMAAEFGTVGTTHPSLKIENPNQYKKIVEMRALNRVDIDEQIRQNNAAVRFLNKEMNLDFIECPTLSMCGANDRFVSPENINVFKKHIKKCVTTAIPESDHFFFMEKPNLVANELNRFFTEVL